jgi:hypothetical protein
MAPNTKYEYWIKEKINEACVSLSATQTEKISSFQIVIGQGQTSPASVRFDFLTTRHGVMALIFYAPAPGVVLRSKLRTASKQESKQAAKEQAADRKTSVSKQNSVLKLIFLIKKGSSSHLFSHKIK